MVASIPGEVDMYDYVIVGAGSAGCVLAARLSEDPDVNVLLLEAGPADTNENIHVPLGYLQLARTEVDWDYCSAPEPHCDYRRIPLPRGKVLGGSSSINAMVYIRGNPLDYDSWGVAGWSWSDLFPYFLKAEDNERGASRWHGVGGPLPVSENRSRNRIAEAFVDAGEQAGLARNEDFNGEAQDGVGIYQVTQRGGQRASAAVAYLHPAMERPNLVVKPYMHVQRVLFEGTRALGVEAQQLGETQQLRAERGRRVRSHADRAVRLEPRRGRWLRARGGRRARPRHAVSRRGRADRRRGHDRSRRPWRVGLPLPADPALAGVGAAGLE